MKRQPKGMAWTATGFFRDHADAVDMPRATVVKDAEAKTHPCLVPYDELPHEQQVKDYLFRAVVLALYNNRNG